MNDSQLLFEEEGEIDSTDSDTTSESESDTSSNNSSSSSSEEEDNIFDAITVKGEENDDNDNDDDQIPLIKAKTTNAGDIEKRRKRLSILKEKSDFCLKKCERKLSIFGIKKRCKTNCSTKFKEGSEKELKELRKIRLKEARKQKEKERNKLERERRRKNPVLEARLVIQIYDITTQRAGDLKTKVGNVILVLSKRKQTSRNQDWWVGRIRFTNRKGLFDSSKTKPYKEDIDLGN